VSHIPDWITTDDYFLSKRNPIANIDQIWVEKKALHLLERDDVRAAIGRATALFATVSQTASPEALSLLESAIQEYGLNYLVKAANSDANHPRIVQNWMYEHEWYGHSIGATRIGGDNQDNGYRLIPVEHGASYRLEGRCLESGPADVTFTIVADAGTSITLASLDSQQLVVESDGRFTVTVDDQPANGRNNHLQTKRGALFVFIRDSLGDWDRERPNALRVSRLSAASAPPISEDEMAWRAIDWMLRDVSLYHWFMYLCLGKPANTAAMPVAAGSVGGLRTQYASTCLVRLAHDEAFVVKANAGGAKYRSLHIHDWWFRTIDPDRRFCSLNHAQMQPDDNGDFTFVISASDPGVHNWLDIGSLHETLLAFRWQGVGPETSQDDLPRVMSAEVVKIDQIKRATAGAKRITKAQRQAQVSARRASYFGRLEI
jgi:hypothetical protein